MNPEPGTRTSALTLRCEHTRTSLLGWARQCRNTATVHLTIHHHHPATTPTNPNGAPECAPADHVYCPEHAHQGMNELAQPFTHELTLLTIFGHSHCHHCGQCVNHLADLIHATRIPT